MAVLGARSTERLARPAAGWLEPASQLGIDGLVAVLALLMAHDPLFLRLSSIEPDDNLVLAYWTLLTLFLVYRLGHYDGDRWLRWSLRHLWPIILVLGVALASPLWSLDPAESAHRAVLLAESTFLGFFIGYRFFTRNLMCVLFGFFVVLLLSSVILALLLPDATIGQIRGGSWAGPVLYKNTLGYLTALAIAFFLIGLLYGRLPRGIALLCLAGAVFVLINTKSASGIIVASMAICLTLVLWLGSMFRIGALLAVIMIVVAPFATAALVANHETMSKLLDRDPTMTNRTTVWADAVEVIKERPLIGFGVDAIWGEKERTYFPYLETTRYLAHAHDGYLDIAAELGLPIALVATVFLLYMLFVALDTYLKTRSSVALFALISLFGFAIYNIGEVGLFEPRRVEWLLCVTIIVSIIRRASEELPENRTSPAPRAREVRNEPQGRGGRCAPAPPRYGGR